MLTIFSGPALKHWRGCENIMMKWYDSQADPDLIYEGYAFNYYDIEGALWDAYLDGRREDDPTVSEDGFSAYCRENAEDYLEDVVFGGYFAHGSKSWHDRL